MTISSIRPDTRCNNENINSVESKTKDTEQVHPNYFFGRLIIRGVGSGIANVIYESVHKLGNPLCYETGFIYGGISGLTNLALRPVYKRIDSKINSAELKTVNYIFSTVTSWTISGGIMHQLYKQTGRELFRVHPGSAIGIAILAGIFGSVNNDLLEPTDSK